MKIKVIMLPTDKATWPNCIWLGRRSGQLRLDTSYNDNPKSIDPIDNSMLPQHIYLIDESAEIKEGKYYFSNQAIRKCIKVKENTSYPYIHLNNLGEEIGDFKTWSGNVIALTGVASNPDDIKVDLPLLSEKSIKLLVDYYNKNGKIPEFVEVEVIRKYDKNPEFYGTGMFNNGYKEIIKLNSRNQVDITIPEEKIYTLKDLELAFNAGRTMTNYKGTWIADLDLDSYTSVKYRTFNDYLQKL